MRLLGSIALVLFSLNLLQFINRTVVGHTAAQPTVSWSLFAAPEAGLDAQLADARRALEQATRRLDRVRGQQHRRRCGTPRFTTRLHRAQQAVDRARIRLQHLHAQQQAEAAVEHELRLRAAQAPEVDPALRARMGLGDAASQIPIMR